MRLAGAAIGVLIAAGWCDPADAGAWAQPKGKGQVIVKLDAMRATDGFDPNGDRRPLLGERRDDTAGVFAEYGLSDRFTVQFKGDWQAGEDAFVDYEGRGPAEIGVTWQVYRGDLGALSLYGGVADGGEGRNAGYAPPGVGERDFEVRLSAGRSFATPFERGMQRGFVEVQAARRMRDGLADETRVDVTLGGHIGDDWLLLAQAYAGAADDDGARWVSVETSAVRLFGAWGLQAGWRQTVAGRETPIASGPVIALWRRF